MAGKNKKTNPFERKMETARYLQPTRVKEFQCIGADCSDSCCKGNWKIFVDKESYYMWQNHLEQEDAQLLKKIVKTKKEGRTSREYAVFKKFTVRQEELLIGADNYIKNMPYCPLLMADSRCKLQRDYGEDSLCHTCYIYPRVGMKVGDAIHRSLALSCPEAVRLLLDSPEKMEFEYIEKTERKPKHVEVELFDSDNREIFDNLLSGGIDILQDRGYELDHRLAALGFAMDKVKSIIHTAEVSAEDRIRDLKEYSKTLTLQTSFPKMQENIANLPKTPKLLFSFLKEVFFDKEQFEWNIDLLEVIQEVFIQEFSLEELEAAYFKRVKPFLESHSYLMENYLINVFFISHKNTFPYNEFRKMALFYGTIKFFLSLSALEGEFSKEKCLLVIQKVNKFFLNGIHIEMMQEELKNRDWNGVYHVLALSCF